MWLYIRVRAKLEYPTAPVRCADGSLAQKYGGNWIAADRVHTYLADWPLVVHARSDGARVTGLSGVPTAEVKTQPSFPPSRTQLQALRPCRARCLRMDVARGETVVWWELFVVSSTTIRCPNSHCGAWTTIRMPPLKPTSLSRTASASPTFRLVVNNRA
jgi:hypothetical protein